MPTLGVGGGRDGWHTGAFSQPLQSVNSIETPASEGGGGTKEEDSDDDNNDGDDSD